MHCEGDATPVFTNFRKIMAFHDPKSRAGRSIRMLSSATVAEGSLSRNRIVLIVDDSEVTRAALTSRLERAGASVVSASSARDALALDASTIAVAIVDVDLGAGDDGVSLADVLTERNPRLRLALFTGEARVRASATRTTFHKPDEVDRVIAWALED